MNLTKEQRASMALGIIPNGVQCTVDGNTYTRERNKWIIYHYFSGRSHPYVPGNPSHISERFWELFRVY